MNLDDLGSAAGRKANEIGRGASRPPFAEVKRRHRRTNVATVSSTTLAVAAVIAVGVAVWPSASADSPRVAAEGPERQEVVARDSCPVTSPDDVAFEPAGDAPDGPPPSYDAVWYGTPELWTMISNQGAWEGLPVTSDGTLTQKTFWWIDDLAVISDPVPDVTVSLELWGDPSASQLVSDDTTTGGRADIGVFAVVGLQIPGEGCWEVTGHHDGATLSYVVWVGEA